jgi:hypothetical protein
MVKVPEQDLRKFSKTSPPAPKFGQGGFIQGNEKLDAVDSPKPVMPVEQYATLAFGLR